MKDAEIIRLNIERYRRMLQGKLEPASRRAIETMMREFEAGLSVEESYVQSSQSTIVTKAAVSTVSSQPMNERTTTKLFAWSLGGIFFVMLALNAAVR